MELKNLIPSASGPLTTAAAAGTEAAAPAVVAPTTIAPAVIDPNTLAPEAKPVVQPIAQERESFVDEWAKQPEDVAPVRTWRDPSNREGANGEYLTAWYDEPVAPPAPAPAAAAPVAAPAAAAPAAAAPAAGGGSYRVSYQGPTDSSDGTTTVMDAAGNVVHTMPGLVGQNTFNNRSEISEEELVKAGWQKPAPVAAPAAAPATA